MAKILLSCVNSVVSLIGYDTEKNSSFWYCPGNVLRSCGACYADDALWIASDNTLTKINDDTVRLSCLPGPLDNLAHSVKAISKDILAVVDTGNSRILLFAGDENMGLESSPLGEWDITLPHDAIHCNDVMAWRDGFLVSAFSYQPFRPVQQKCPTWKEQGLGVIFYLRRASGHTISSIVASGLNCPHSMVEHEGCIYCCSSSSGDFYRYVPAANGTLNFDCSWSITKRHFLRGALRIDNGWLLGGSSRRESDSKNSGMMLFYLDDNGSISEHSVANAGEIYEILPWDNNIMRSVAKQCMKLPTLDLPGEFPPLCKDSMLDE